ncbi:ATP-binding protein [Shewanella woodyi]|uniref:histidine kinase n=1 Tax=Shewanella woodyi (strain ATCC 51908 / MS32) TaxID=392500 RepID=B1KG83_SHEWM|nr:ATP-binding protein [Shewanella woodyi]ACA88220.1 integral membrane sensor signal transduction histidine kinase [Shewanella woodyi ATCC 51908]
MKLRNSVFIAIFATALISTIFLLLLQQIRFSYAFNEYMSKSRTERIEKLHLRLTDGFAETGNWQFLTDQFDTANSDNNTADEQNLERLNKWLLWFDFPRGVAILDANNAELIGEFESNMQLTAIFHQNEEVGFLAVKDNSEVKAELDSHFVKQQIRSLIFITLLTLLTALLSAYFFSRKLTRPISDIANVLNNLRKGDFSTRSEYKHSNELGQLSSDVNYLANTLEQNRDSRQRWITDISHELRTPITIMMGELECLEDGLTPFDSKAVTSLKEEVSGLNKLVADLHQLTIAEQGELRLECQPNNISEMVQKCLQKYQPIFTERDITTTNQLPSSLIAHVDKTRLQQVLVNLFENCARYTDIAGDIRISASQDNQFVTLVIENTAPEISEESLPKLFDRLYRVDESRNKFSGGSGLGLAICTAIVEAHGGKIRATYSSLNGLAVSMTLPVSSII